MQGTFSNTIRAEYTEEDQGGSNPRRRIFYASWTPEVVSTPWVRAFKDALNVYGTDEFDVAIDTSRIRDEPGTAGEVDVQGRDGVDTTALGEVTDFVAVLTTPYFLAQRKVEPSELSWMIQTIEAKKQVTVVWLAALERHINLKRLKLGNRSLGDFPFWHGTKDERNERLLEAYVIPGPDPNSIQQFRGEVNSAVDTVLKHGGGCSICKSNR